MSIPNTRPVKRRPTHPGDMLREDFLPDFKLSVAGLANAAGVSRQSIKRVIARAPSSEPGDGLATCSAIRQLARILAERAARSGFMVCTQALKDEVFKIKPLREQPGR